MSGRNDDRGVQFGEFNGLVAGQIKLANDALMPVGSPALVHDLRLDLRPEV
ncbi:hypothetical protein D3C77_804510 [compost metagenome]